VSDVFVELSMKDQREETLDFLDEGVLQVEEDMWTMYFNGTSN